METRRLELLVALARLGSMRAVGEELGITTSTVSQQLAALAAETGSTLLEPVGRHVRLTPAGRRLADHGVTILAAVEAARRDLDADAEPTGTVRIAGFASAIRRSLIPLLPSCAAPIRGCGWWSPSTSRRRRSPSSRRTASTSRWSTTSPRAAGSTTAWGHAAVDRAWGLGVPAADPAPAGDAVATIARYRDHEWIVNSRNDADELAVPRWPRSPASPPRCGTAPTAWSCSRT